MNHSHKDPRPPQRVRRSPRRNETASSPVVYGIHPVSELLSSRPQSIEKILIEAQRSSAQLFEILKRARSLRIATQMVPSHKLDETSGDTKHQGVVAVCAIKPYAEWDDIQEKLRGSGQSALVVIPASIEDPRNLGSLVRSCVAFGVDAMLLEKKNTAPLSPVSAKASAGMIEHLQIAKPRNLEGIVEELSKSGFSVVGADMNGDKDIWDTDLTGPTVLILGGEHKGIPPYLAKKCTATVRIPIRPECSSLNVSTAGTVMLYETARQRSVHH